MSEQVTERRLRQWLETQHGVRVPDDLRTRVAAIPREVARPWPRRLGEALGLLPRDDRRAHWMASVVALVVLAALVVAGAVFVGSRPDNAVEPAPSHPTPSQALMPTPSASGTPTPARLQPIPSGDLSCVNDLLDVAPAHGPAEPLAHGAPDGARFAYVRPVAPDAGGGSNRAQVIVEGGGVATVVALISSSRPFGGGDPLSGASIEGWSVDGGTLVVWAGRWSPSIWYHECSNLWLVASDGSSVIRLSDNRRPGYSVTGSGYTMHPIALSPDGRSAVFTEATPTGATVLIAGRDGTTAVDTACAEGDRAFTWSPDSRSLAIACRGGGIDILDVASGGSRTTMEASAAADAAWRPDGRLAVAVARPTLHVDVLDPASGSLVVGVAATRPDLGVLGFSPDATLVLATGCPPATRANPDECLATELDVIDAATGVSRTLWTGPAATTLEADRTAGSLDVASWLPDGTIVLPDPAGSGTLRIDPATGDVTPVDVPGDAAWWMPPR